MTRPPAGLDRRPLLAASDTLNGIDFVEVAPDQVQLFVHFLNAVAVKGSLRTAGGPPVTITGGEVVPSIPVRPIDEATAWSADSSGRPVLALSVAGPGDMSTYRLTVFSATLDPFFDEAPLRFHTDSGPGMDGTSTLPSPAAPVGEPVPIDYLAKDFASFRQALSDFSTLRYPAWVERSEADLGVVLMEALAAIADELSYYQDRVAAESTIQTATQGLSRLRHARLVDYEPTPATVATAVLQLEVNPPPSGSSWVIDTPLRVRALGADGSIVEFEFEDPQVGLAAGPVAPAPAWPTVDTRWNRSSLTPYCWDDTQRRLPAGATDFYVRGSALGLYPGQQLLLDSPAAFSADPPVRELVTVSGHEETRDELLGNVELTRIFLLTPTTADHDLTATAVAGNIVPVVQGIRQSETFTIPLPGVASPAPVVVRLAANWTPQDPRPDYRYCLSSGPLAWLPESGEEEYSATPRRPEMIVTEVAQGGGQPPASPRWQFARWMLDAGPADQVFTLTPEQYSPVLTGNRTTWLDYDGDGGTTVRFGDGRFGVSPSPGTTFTVLYRVGGGPAGNVPADTIVNVAPGQAQGSIVASCTNPFAATGGRDAESFAEVRTGAAQRFSAELLRAVLPEDYSVAAESSSWVRQAGTAFRWTGSWLTVFTSADPVANEQPTAAQLESLTALLARRRLAGYESYVLRPRYVSVDLQITVVGLATAFASDVAAAVLARLQPGMLPNGSPGFFDHSRWGFGQPFESSALLAAIQSCTGVAGVSDLLYRQRGVEPSFVPLRETLAFAPDEILRVENDPNRPEAGSLHVTVRGSK